MDTKTYAIILDTNTFGKIEHYNFKKSTVVICLDALADYSNIKVFMPTIVYKELKKHIRTVVDETIKKIDSNFTKQYFDKKKMENIYEQKVAELDKFIKKYDITFLDCEKYSDIKEVNKWYFNNEKPFSIEKPKEFPDAMILSSTIHYFEENKYDEVIMISEDKDIVGGIKEHSKFEVRNSIQDVLNELIDFSLDEYRECHKYITTKDILENINTYSFYSYNIEDDYEIEEINAKLNNMKFIDKNTEEHYIQVCANCSLDVYGEFHLVDDRYSVYDREDPDCSVYWYSEGNYIHVDDVDVFIAIRYSDKNKFEDYEVTIVNDIVLNDYIDQLELVDEI